MVFLLKDLSMGPSFLRYELFGFFVPLQFLSNIWKLLSQLVSVNLLVIYQKLSLPRFSACGLEVKSKNMADAKMIFQMPHIILQSILQCNACCSTMEFFVLPRSFVVDIFETHGLVYIEAKAIRIRLSYGHKGAPRYFAGLTTHGFATSNFDDVREAQVGVATAVLLVAMSLGQVLIPPEKYGSPLNLKSLQMGFPCLGLDQMKRIKRTCFLKCNEWMQTPFFTYPVLYCFLSCSYLCLCISALFSAWASCGNQSWEIFYVIQMCWKAVVMIQPLTQPSTPTSARSRGF